MNTARKTAALSSCNCGLCVVGTQLLHAAVLTKPARCGNKFKKNATMSRWLTKMYGGHCWPAVLAQLEPRLLRRRSSRMTNRCSLHETLLEILDESSTNTWESAFSNIILFPAEGYINFLSKDSKQSTYGICMLSECSKWQPLFTAQIFFFGVYIFLSYSALLSVWTASKNAVFV